MASDAAAAPTPVIDGWVAIWDEATAGEYASMFELGSVERFFGTDLAASGHAGVDALIGSMDDNGIDLAIVSGRLSSSRFGDGSNDGAMSASALHPDRLRVALGVDPIGSIRATCDAIEAASSDGLVAAIRIVPFLSERPINDRSYYPIYERCEGLGLPVTVNVGVPGPLRRARYQDPIDLDDVCLDFPGLTVIGAHMGNPWESLLVRLMMRFENLHLSTSAYLARYFDPALVKFMASSRGERKIIFASDDPIVPIGRAITDARALALDVGPMAAFLGGNAARCFRIAPLLEEVA